MRKVIFIFCFLLCFISFSHAQMVETVVAHPEIRDGLHTDKLGNIYAASGGFAGSTIGKFDIQNDLFTTSFISGFSGPVDVDFYQDSLFIITNYDNNTVSNYNVNTGLSNIIAYGLDGPSGIVIDNDDNIFIANWGGAPAFAGNQIHRIDPSGSVNLYIDSPILYRPQAMSLNQEGKLVVFAKQNLYTVNPIDSTLQFWANVGMKIGHMKFRKQDSCIYGTAIDLHKIIKIDPAGNVSIVAGTTIGYEDGPANSAKFRSPLGIEFSPSEDTLYISEAGYNTNTGRLRRILLSQTVKIPELEINQVKLYPNPTKDIFQVENASGKNIKIEVFDIKGEKIISKTEKTNKILIDLSTHAKGSYFIKMIINHEIVTKKLIKY